MKLRHVVALIFILMGVVLLGYSYNAKLAIAKPIPVAIEKGPYKVVALDPEGSPLSISSMSLAEGEYPELSKFVLEIKTQGFFMVSHDSLPIGVITIRIESCLLSLQYVLMNSALVKVITIRIESFYCRVLLSFSHP